MTAEVPIRNRPKRNRPSTFTMPVRSPIPVVAPLVPARLVPILGFRKLIPPLRRKTFNAEEEATALH